MASYLTLRRFFFTSLAYIFTRPTGSMLRCIGCFRGLTARRVLSGCPQLITGRTLPVPFGVLLDAPLGFYLPDPREAKWVLPLWHCPGAS